MTKTIKIKANLNFEKVDIFLQVKGRLPMKMDDYLTQEILDDYCRKFEAGQLTKGMVSLNYMYRLIKTGKIKPTVTDCNSK